jgi:hypothetical protein
MKKQISLLLSIILVLSVTAISFASKEQNTQSHSFRLMQAATSLQITGTAKSINAEAGTLTVSKKFKDKTIEVTAGIDNKTKIMKGEEKKGIQDITAGAKVILVYTGEDGKNRAKSISIQ